MTEEVAVPFQGFPSIPRLTKTVVVSEKIDGTNGIIHITNEGKILAGSRSRWLDTTSKGDNFGFCKWVMDNKDELLKLGPGTHYGEWWGSGIQRRYGLNEKRFSLFNTARWTEPYEATKAGHKTSFPKCCHVVPVLDQFDFDTTMVDGIMEALKKTGSIAAPNFMDPEGIVIYHTASKQLFKKTFDDSHKGK